VNAQKIMNITTFCCEVENGMCGFAVDLLPQLFGPVSVTRIGSGVEGSEN
jgi:hypothetical protein